ncbi:MAG: hypothetical protein LBB86_00065 [Oscillospiraceae bacterium]|jgi:diketogulonate reductase-like aldo/keto reductase|nr:hypothetical protein [Oscillospiraceae bacterium]
MVRHVRHHKVGAAIERAVKDSAVRRDELFINSKVWNDMHGRGDPMLSLAKTLTDLRMDYVDCFVTFSSEITGYAIFARHEPAYRLSLQQKSD